MHTHMHMSAHTHMHAHIHIHMHTHTRAHTHTHTHTHVQLVYVSGSMKLMGNEYFLVTVVRPVSPPSILEIRMEGNMFVTHYDMEMKCLFFDGRSVSLCVLVFKCVCVLVSNMFVCKFSSVFVC